MLHGSLDLEAKFKLISHFKLIRSRLFLKKDSLQNDMIIIAEMISRTHSLITLYLRFMLKIMLLKSLAKILLQIQQER